MKKLLLLAMLLAPSAVFAKDAPAVNSTDNSAAASESENSAVPQREYWDPGVYVGLDMHLGWADLNQSGFGREWNENPFGFSFDAFAGYKLPYFRIGGEMGYFTTSKEFNGTTVSGKSVKVEEDRFWALTFMPHAFFDIDIPGWRVNPYVGAGIGAGLLKGQYDFYVRNGYVYNTVQNYVSDATVSLTYAFMLGIRVALNPRLELNLGYRYQDYGKVGVDGYDNSLSMNSFNVGVAGKF